MSDSRFPPENYFDGQDLQVASAIYNNNKSTLKNYIKEPNFDINKLGKQGISYLLYALMVNQKKMMEILLENGADPNLINPELTDNASKEAPQIIVNELPLSYVARNFFAYDLDYVKLLVKYGANINDTRTEPPLIVCMGSGDNKRKLKLIEYFLDHGANINIQDNNRQYSTNSTPIISAADISLWDIVNYLLDRGADYRAVDNAGWSVAYSVQDEISMNKGTADRKEKVHALKRRLEKLGIEFPVPRGINIYKQKQESEIAPE